VGVGDVANVLEVYSASIFMVKACEVTEFLCICGVLFEKMGGREGSVGIGAPPGASGTVNQESCALNPFMGPEITEKEIEL
jgi:hypothetical protein